MYYASFSCNELTRRMTIFSRSDILIGEGNNHVRFVGVGTICLRNGLNMGWMLRFFTDTNFTSISNIIRNFVGEFVAAKVLTVPGYVRVEEGEVISIHENL